MKSMLGVCLIAVGLWGLLNAQDPTKLVLREGIHVEMATASHAVEMPAADKEDATVVSVTREGKVYVGVQPVEIERLANLSATAVYVKADARASFQQVLKVLNVLERHSLVLLTAPTTKAAPGSIARPYGMEVRIGSGQPR